MSFIKYYYPQGGPFFCVYAKTYRCPPIYWKSANMWACIHTHTCIFFHVYQNIHVAMKEMCVLTFECWLIFKPWFDLKEMASLNFTTIKFYFISTMEGWLPSVFPEIRNISNILAFKCLYESKGPWKRIQL